MKSHFFCTRIASTVCIRSNCSDWPEYQPKNIEISLAKKLGVIKTNIYFLELTNFDTTAQKRKCWIVFFVFSWAVGPETSKTNAGEAEARQMMGFLYHSKQQCFRFQGFPRPQPRVCVIPLQATIIPLSKIPPSSAPWVSYTIPSNHVPAFRESPIILLSGTFSQKSRVSQVVWNGPWLA